MDTTNIKKEPLDEEPTEKNIESVETDKNVQIEKVNCKNIQSYMLSLYKL